MGITKRLAVKSAGMVTAIGFNFTASCAAMRAGHGGATEGNLWDKEVGDNISACKVFLPQWCEGLEKFADLIVPAIVECTQQAKNIQLAKIPILLCVADHSRPYQHGSDHALLEDIERKLNIPHNPSSIVIPHGHVAGVVALEYARKLMINQGFECCIVAGVDSYLRQETVDYYMENRRLLTKSNSNGFILGEAGCAVLIGFEEEQSEGELVIHGIGFGEEKGIVESDIPLSGDGITQAIRTAFEESELTYFDIDYRLTDLNGEHYKFMEVIISEGRIGRKYDEQGVNRDKFKDLWHPIEYTGEIGAAIGPCVLSWALHAGQCGYAPGKVVLCHFSNDNGKRAALVARYSE